jgi:lipopolysaccharide export system protein LptA
MKKSLRHVKILTILALLCICAGTLWAVEAHVTADSMVYHSRTGDFTADGNVRIQRVDLLIMAPTGKGNLDNRHVTLSGGVHITGKWEQEPVDLKSTTLEGDLSENGWYSLLGGVSGYIGPRSVEAQELKVSKTAFEAEKVKKFEDSQQKMFLSASSIKGKIKNGETSDIQASGNVVIIIIGTDGQKTRITGSNAVYSQAQDLVKVRGNALAVQPERTLRAEEILYSPKSGKMSASGKPQVTIQMQDKKGNSEDERKDS